MQEYEPEKTKPNKSDSFGRYIPGYEEQYAIWCKIPRKKVINVCSCGKEWKSEDKTYQENCYPYEPVICDNCIQKANDEKERIERENQITKFENQLPLRFKGQLEKPIHTQLLKASCSIIWGGFGTGKTWESLSVAKELISNGSIKDFKFSTEMGILLDLQDGFEERREKIDLYSEYDFLIIDESGKTNDSTYNVNLIYEIINRRYNNLKKTIMICNASTKDEVKNLLASASLDRFRECVVEMSGKSKRYVL